MAEEEKEHADVEAVAGEAQIPALQDLARLALPRVGVSIEAHEAAEEKHGACEVRIDAEEELVEPAHVGSPVRDAARRWMCATGTTFSGVRSGSSPCAERPSRSSSCSIGREGCTASSAAPRGAMRASASNTPA